jgi:hypothetical protein
VRYEGLEVLRMCRDIADDLVRRHGRNKALQYAWATSRAPLTRTQRRNWSTIYKMILTTRVRSKRLQGHAASNISNS